MGIIAFCMGTSGSGKTSSLRNMDPQKTGVFQVINKPFSFKDPGFKTVKGATYKQIIAGLKGNSLKTYVIDDSQELMVSAAFSQANVQGYSKYTNLARDFKQLIDVAKDCTSDDTLVFFMHHAIADANTGFIRCQTLGQILTSWVSIEAYTSINLLADKDGNKHFFRTEFENSSCKTPIGMFEDRIIPNDLALVEKYIREYYGI